MGSRHPQVHVHGVLRIDGRGDAGPPAVLDAGLLAVALRVAAARVSVPHKATGYVARWGDQVDVRVLDDTAEGAVGAGAVANYIAKYATKSVDTSGVLDRRIRSEVDLDERPLSPHLRRLATSAWVLGEDGALQDLRLRLWAHDLGYRGHWLTKSRSWSTAGSRLRCSRGQRSVDRHDALVDADGRSLDLQVVPAQGAGFPAAHAGGRDEPDERRHPLIGEAGAVQ